MNWPSVALDMSKRRCGQNNLELNLFKAVEMTVNLRRSSPTLFPSPIPCRKVSVVETFRFLGSIITHDLKWVSKIDTMIKHGPVEDIFLAQLRKLNLPQDMLILFLTATIKSVLCSSNTIWLGWPSTSRNRLQWAITAAEKMICANLPSIQDLTYGGPRKGQEAPLQIHHNLFNLLHSIRRQRALQDT